MLLKILSSNWVAIPVWLIAGALLVVLYLKGRALEAKLGAGLLVIALALIIWGRIGSDPDVKD
jgi:hypothetical protein